MKIEVRVALLLFNVIVLIILGLASYAEFVRGTQLPVAVPLWVLFAIGALCALGSAVWICADTWPTKRR